MNTTRILISIAAATGLALAATSPASAAISAEPAVTASPSTGLPAEAAIEATVTGFGTAATVYLAQCAFPDEVLVCDEASVQTFTTDGSGNGSVTVTVHSNFAGTIIDGSDWGTVNCAAVAGGCYVVAGDDSLATLARTSVSFG